MLEQQIYLALKGEQSAYTWLNERYRAMGLAIANRLLGDRQLAEDAVQEAWAEVFVNLSRLKEPAAFPGWYATIVRRQCGRLIRPKRVATEPMDTAIRTVPDPTSTPVELVQQQEMMNTVQRYIQALPTKLSLAVQLFYIMGYSVAETAAALDIPLSTLKKRLYDARQKLRISLPVADLLGLPEILVQGGKRKMLHIVNGDHVASKLSEAGIEGEILFWREMYTEGPHSLESSQEQLMRRSQFMESTFGIPSVVFEGECKRQESVLDKYILSGNGEIVLWFEYDLFDQTILTRLLHYLASQSEEIHERVQIHLLTIGDYPGIEPFRGLGQLTPKQLFALAGSWKQLNSKDLALGKAYWEAYNSADPLKLQSLIRDDKGELPFTADAFRFHLTRFPDTLSGLGIVERTLLRLIEQNHHKGVHLRDLFRTLGDELRWMGMTDLEFAFTLEQFSADPEPLIKFADQTAFPKYGESVPEFWNNVAQLTERGRDIMAGRLDRIAAYGIDTHLGGVHLRDKGQLWRWDEDAQQLVQG